MDWRAVNFDWNRALAFLVTAEEGSFSAAGRALDLTQPTVGRQIAALEDQLDVLLFDRVGNGLRLTPTGADLLEHLRAMCDAATRFALAAAGQSLSLEGTVCISASQIDATFTLPAIVARLRKAHPGIQVELVATNESSDLSRREADIALRSYRPTDVQLVARKVGDERAHLYASKTYLCELGNPTTPQELSRGEFIGFNKEKTLMNGLNALGLSLTDKSFPIICENQLAQWEMAKQGAGIVIMTESVGDAEPLVRRALPSLAPICVPVWLTTHRELSTNRRLRVVFDFLLEALKE